VSFERPEVAAGRFAFQHREAMSLLSVGDPAWETIRRTAEEGVAPRLCWRKTPIILDTNPTHAA